MISLLATGSSILWYCDRSWATVRNRQLYKFDRFTIQYEPVPPPLIPSLLGSKASGLREGEKEVKEAKPAKSVSLPLALGPLLMEIPKRLLPLVLPGHEAGEQATAKSRASQDAETHAVAPARLCSANCIIYSLSQEPCCPRGLLEF